MRIAQLDPLRSAGMKMIESSTAVPASLRGARRSPPSSSREESTERGTGGVVGTGTARGEGGVEGCCAARWAARKPHNGRLLLPPSWQMMWFEQIAPASRQSWWSASGLPGTAGMGVVGLRFQCSCAPSASARRRMPPSVHTRGSVAGFGPRGSSSSMLSRLSSDSLPIARGTVEEYLNFRRDEAVSGPNRRRSFANTT